MKNTLFYIDELYGFLGEFAEEYDIDGIIEETTFIDYETQMRYWNDIDEVELWEICQEHYLS